MRLEEAIKQCEEKADELKHKVETWVHCPSDPNWEKDLKDFEDCKECAEEHEQLAKWLRELQTYKQKGCSYASYASKQRAYKEGKYDGFMESPYGD